ncbi:MAG: NAD(P)/FAD-dependent oxidoreductase [Candidatus Kariarchaeaceae archaeon]|jgi:thioredoxin reductase (NADPH)
MLDRIKRPMPSDIECDIVVIGAGPAGITAAHKLKNRGKDVWILGSVYESQLAKAGALVDVTKIPEGTIGLDHVEAMMNTAKEIGVQNKTSLCTGIEVGDQFIVKTKYQNFKTSKVLIATGCKQVPLEFTGEASFLHKGISDCAVCDWGLFRGKKIAVVGNHEYTLRATKFMRDHSPEVHLLWYQQEEKIEEENIHFYSNVTNLEAKGTDTLEKLVFQSNAGSHEIEVDGLFVEGKPQPATKYLEDSGIDLKDGFVLIDGNYATNIKGIWAIGDVTGQTDKYDDAVNHGEQVVDKILG